MVRFSALVPDATINYVKNPAMRYDATGWTASGATLTRSLDYARFGIASLKVVTAGTALRQGAFYRVNALAGISEPITVSAYARGTGRVRIRLIDNPAGREWASASVQLETDRWTRLDVSGFSTGRDDMRLYVETDEKVATARTFYVDGAQMERKSYPTTYCDGDQPGCRWAGTYHNSISSRNAYTREGGRWVQLAGKERQAQDLYMTVVGGLGVAPITNNTQSFALAPGSYFQNSRTVSRSITLTFHAKHLVEDGSDNPVSLAHLHQLRQLLIDVVKPDKTSGGQEIWFEYDDGETPVYFQARYDGGLEGEWDIRNQFVNSFPLRLLAVSPYMLEDNQEVATVDFQEHIFLRNIVQRKEGLWDRMNGGFSSAVARLTAGPRGEVYAIGSFSQANIGGSITPNSTANGIVYWDGERWISLNTVSLGGASINDVAVAANGYVYVTGTFTSIGGVAANRIAYWNGSAWNAMGTGLNEEGTVVRIAPNGDVYVGGAFTTAGGVSCARIARWDGLQWRRVGQFGGLDNFVRALQFSRDGSILYVGGDFLNQNGLGTNLLVRVAQYNTTTGLFSAMGSGFNNIVYYLYLSSSDALYAGGEFTASGSETVNRISQWNGVTWIPLGTGVDNTVLSIHGFNNGNIVIGGTFQNASGRRATGVALWNGSTFYNQDFSFASPTVNSVLVQKDTQDLIIAGSFEQNIYVSGITTVNNPGSAEAYPVFYIFGPGNLSFIENQSSGKRLYLNLSLLDDEEVFIDPARGRIESTGRGDLYYTLVPGSDFRSFRLLPGENKIAAFMVNDVGALMQVSFRPIHWSADATQHGESL